MNALATMSCIVASLDVLFNWIALDHFNGGLELAAAASALCTVLSAAVSLLLVVCFPPSKSVRFCQSGNARISKKMITDYFKASGNLVVRSVLLSSCVWGMSVAASNISASALAANQALMQLWMVTSYICDGVADAATIKGSKLLGAGRSDLMPKVCRRLIFYGIAVGVVCSALMFALKNPLISMF